MRGVPFCFKDFFLETDQLFFKKNMKGNISFISRQQLQFFIFNNRCSIPKFIDPKIYLTAFYQKVLNIPPYRKGEYGYENSRRFDDIVDMDDFVFKAAWFRMDRGSKMLELMQYVNPIKTPSTTSLKSPTDLGYSFSIEVEDIQAEYLRLKKLDVNFLSEPHILGEFWMVFANDVDGNAFSLRQATSPASIYAIKNVVGKK